MGASALYEALVVCEEPKVKQVFIQNSSMNLLTADSLSGVVVVILPLRNCRLKLWSR